MNEAQIFKELCEESFSFFAQQYLKVIEPETPFEWNWHHELLCEACEMVFYGTEKNIDINIAPRTLKSIIVSVLFPAWCWIKKHHWKIIAASRSNSLAIEFNLKRRNLIESKEFLTFWPLVLKDDQNTTQKFGNYYNGFMQAVSAEGKITGVGADLLISDDLLDASEAKSKAKRESVNHWFSTAFFGRVQSKREARRININQRLHLKDVSGNIRANHPKYKRLIIPMEKTEKTDSTIAYKDPRKIGEFMQPSRYGPEEKADDVKALGSSGYSEQFQQSPRPAGGGIIKEEWIRYYKTLPEEFDTVFLTGDLNFKEGEDLDYVSFMAWGKVGEKRYLIDVVRGKWSYKNTKEHWKAFCLKHPGVFEKWIEDKANGPALISDFKEQMPGLHPWPPDERSDLKKLDKVQRTHMVSADFENGNVYLPDPEMMPIAAELVLEITGMTDKGPTTDNDDMIDTTTMALIQFKKPESFFGA